MNPRDTELRRRELADRGRWLDMAADDERAPRAEEDRQRRAARVQEARDARETGRQTRTQKGRTR